MLILTLFATSLPIISFSQTDYSTNPTIIQQIPSTNTQPQPGYLILATIIINDSGGTKVSSDFTVNIAGNSFILASFQALPAPEIKIVSLQEGNYSLSLSNVQGYKVSQQNQCHGEIKSGEVKTCLVTLNDDATATAPFPPSQCPVGQHLDQTTQQCVPNTPLPPDNKPPVANAGPDLTVEHKKTVMLNGSPSIDPDGTITSYQWSQISGPQVTINNANTAIASFTAPDLSTPPPPPPLPPSGDKDEFGMSILGGKPTGNRIAMVEGSDHENGKRYNVNHKFHNYIMQGYYKLGSGQEAINHKGDGPNHGGCSSIPECLWYEFDVYLDDGRFSLQYEIPHPDNHNVPDSASEHVQTIGQLNEGNWIGWATAYYWGPDGKRHMKAYIDPNPFPNNDPNQKPLNNWIEGIFAIENGQIVSDIDHARNLQQVIDHEDGFESEIRMHGATNGDTEMKNAWVIELQPQNTQGLSTLGIPVKWTTLPDTGSKAQRALDEEDGLDDDAPPKPSTRAAATATPVTLGFQLQVTDDKGAKSTDTTTVSVIEGTPLPPPPQCPVGQQLDQTTQQCVPIPLPPPPQCPVGQQLDQTTQQCVPIPPQTDTPFHFTAAGDFRDNTNTDENMAANNPEIVLILGDFSYNGNAEQWWSKNMDALNNLNIIGALGNHDEPNDDFLNLWPLNEGKWEFIYKVSNVAFVAFDTENNDPSTIDPLLAQAQADPTVDHIIPFGHKTVFTPIPGNPLKPDADRGYFDVFKKYDKIRMILGGHNHFYARMNAVSGTDFVYVTVGNGGANPHKDSGESGSPPKQYVKSNGALHCDVNSDTISCKMISNEGKVWDEFTITPGNPPASKQNPAQAPKIISQQIPSLIIQQIPPIDKQSQTGYPLGNNNY
jgi:predicted phosphodiesterase